MAPLQPFVPFQLVSSAVQCKAEESESPAFNLVETWLAATPLTNHPPCCQEGKREKGGGRPYFSHRVFNLKNIPVLPSKNDTKMFKMSNMAENYFRIAKMRSRGDFS